MAITRFEDLPSTNTPINSTNLNGNFDELGVKVGTSVDNNYRVNVLHSKNLFDGKAIYFSNATETNITNGKRISNVGSGAAFVLYLIKNVSNDVGKTFALKASFTSGRIAIGLCDESGTNRIFGQYIDTGNTSISYTIPSLTTSKYLAVWLYGSVGTGTVTNDYTNIMINEGSTALDYEPYVTSSINVDGETIYTKGQDGIIESGSNANGNYIKFADGTLICTIIKNINIPINTAWGSLYIGDTDTKYTYPIAFVGNNPVVNYSITGYNSAFVISWRQSSNKLVETDVFALVRGNTASAQNYVLNITAIGKWK